MLYTMTNLTPNAAKWFIENSKWVVEATDTRLDCAKSLLISISNASRPFQAPLCELILSDSRIVDV